MSLHSINLHSSIFVCLWVRGFTTLSGSCTLEEVKYEYPLLIRENLAEISPNAFICEKHVNLVQTLTNNRRKAVCTRRVCSGCLTLYVVLFILGIRLWRRQLRRRGRQVLNTQLPWTNSICGAIGREGTCLVCCELVRWDADEQVGLDAFVASSSMNTFTDSQIGHSIVSWKGTNDYFTNLYKSKHKNKHTNKKNSYDETHVYTKMWKSFPKLIQSGCAIKNACECPKVVQLLINYLNTRRFINRHGVKRRGCSFNLLNFNLKQGKKSWNPCRMEWKEIRDSKQNNHHFNNKKLSCGFSNTQKGLAIFV